jgi:hypothetical protein
MWPTLLSQLSFTRLALAFVILCCRPKSVALLIDSVNRLLTVLPRDKKRSRPERALDALRALREDTPDRKHRKRRALPPGPPP